MFEVINEHWGAQFKDLKILHSGVVRIRRFEYGLGMEIPKITQKKSLDTSHVIIPYGVEQSTPMLLRIQLHNGKEIIRESDSD